MNPFEAVLLSVTITDGERWGRVSVRGAQQRVSLALVPDARAGDLLLCDAGVAIAVLDPSHPTLENHHVPRNSR